MLTTATRVVLKAPDIVSVVQECLSRHEETLAETNAYIHQNPELKYEEHKAHDRICELLESLGYAVTRHAYGLDTSFEVEYGSGGRLVVFNAEYDALPGMGHACGHNLIATSSIAAFIATAAAIKASGVSGRVRLLGTPAEESGGGKIKLLNAGAYKNVDACLMGHPGPSPLMAVGEDIRVDGMAAVKTSARKQVRVTFKGQNAHAGLTPWYGKNALDAVVASYINISLLRQQMKPTARVHGVIRQGGQEPNIIPDTASLEYFVREVTDAAASDLATRIEACFNAGAQATGCTADVHWLEEVDYKDLVPSMTLARLFTNHMSEIGKHYQLDARSQPAGASTDMGNVCYEVPGFHCTFSVGGDHPGVSPHHPDFAAAAGTKEAFSSAIACAKGMAMTAFDIIQNEDHAAEAHQEFQATLGHAYQSV